MPYKSKAQERYFNVHRAEMERQGVNVDEWNKMSKGMKLPMHAKYHSHDRTVMTHKGKQKMM